MITVLSQKNPRQGNLFPRERSRPTVAARVDQCRVANLQAAAIILESRERYGGEGSLMVIWARAVLYGSEPQAAEWRLTA